MLVLCGNTECISGPTCIVGELDIVIIILGVISLCGNASHAAAECISVCLTVGVSIINRFLVRGGLTGSRVVFASGHRVRYLGTKIARRTIISREYPAVHGVIINIHSLGLPGIVISKLFEGIFVLVPGIKN